MFTIFCMYKKGLSVILFQCVTTQMKRLRNVCNAVTR